MLPAGDIARYKIVWVVATRAVSDDYIVKTPPEILVERVVTDEGIDRPILSIAQVPTLHLVKHELRVRGRFSV